MQKNPYENVIAVTNRSLCQRPFAEQIERVCSLHPKAVILREKDLPEEEYSRLAEQILEICKRYQVPCILHTLRQDIFIQLTVKKDFHPEDWNFWRMSVKQ